MTKVQVTLMQESLVAHGYSIDVDGYLGQATKSAIQRHEEQLTASSKPSGNVKEGFPSPANKDNFFGKPREGYPYLTTFPAPYPMVLSWDKSKSASKIGCHVKVADQMEAALKEVGELGDEYIKKHGLHLYGGCYNHRKIRGGSTWSDHAYGIAIDINPDANGLHTPWSPEKAGQSGYGDMPVKVVEIFEKHGFCNIAKSIGRDVMHFAAVRYY